MVESHKDLLTQAFLAGVDACRAERTLPNLLPKSAPKGRTIVLGAGKAAGDMALVADKTLAGDVHGLVVTRYGHKPEAAPKHIKILESGHPIPDDRSLSAALSMLDLAKSATQDDRVLFLFSGGGSSLLSCPADGVSVEEKRRITGQLVKSGASISETNLARAHLSKIKGGKLARAAARAELYTYVVSDVVGDDPAIVASGPSIATSYDPEQALQIFHDYGIEISPLAKTAIFAEPSRIDTTHPVEVIARSKDALDAIAAYLEQNGWWVVRLGDDLEGDAGATGGDHAREVLERRRKNEKVALISGGELTVKVVNQKGRGGPNLEYLTSLLIGLNGASDVEAIACDSDGIDGSEDNAGGYIDGGMLTAAREKGLDAAQFLRANDTYALFSELGALIKTGPTRTNVNDIRIILVH